MLYAVVGKRGIAVILYCDAESCIYNECGKCEAGKAEIVGGKCETFIERRGWSKC